MTDFSKNNHFPYLYLAMNLFGHFGSEVLATFLYESLSISKAFYLYVNLQNVR